LPCPHPSACKLTSPHILTFSEEGSSCEGKAWKRKSTLRIPRPCRPHATAGARLGTGAPLSRVPLERLGNFCLTAADRHSQVKESKKPKEEEEGMRAFRHSHLGLPAQTGSWAVATNEANQKHPTFACAASYTTVQLPRPTIYLHTWRRYKEHVVSISSCVLQVRKHRPLC
jgi:hypothetical protein